MMDEIARKAVDEALRKIREGRASEGKEQKPQKDAEKKPQEAPEGEKKGKTVRSLILSEAEFEKQLQDFFLNKQRVRPPQKEVRFVEKKDPYKDKRVYVTCEITVHNMPSDFFDALLKETLRQLDQKDEYRIDVALVDLDTIKEYNASTRGIDKITDVLSYPAADFASPLKLREGAEGFLRDDFSGLFQLGEIIICRPVCEAQAREFGHSVEREMGYLFVHGVLHLLGFDHDTDEKYRQMRIVEEKVLARVGLKA